ncbi:MAG: hypothetical protein L0220_23715 [Acidobacteria bacterium]|nr:hypothetical protein [Acidobacteriota bacterium]
MSLSKPILAITAIILLLGFFYSNHKEKPFNRREKLRSKAPPERQKITIHSLSNNNRSTFVIDLPPGFYVDDEQSYIPYDFTVPDKYGREIHFRGNLKLVREDEDTLIATPDRDMAYVTGELLAHVIENLGELIERRINNLHKFTDGYEEGRRNSKKAPSIPTTPTNPTNPIIPPGSRIRPD